MTSTPVKSDRAFHLLELALVVAAGFAALHGLGRPLWLDDTHSTYHAFQGLGGVVESLRTDSHPPLYFWFLAAWMQIGGLAEAWLRLPSVAFTLAAGGTLFLHGRRTQDARLAWLFVLFFLFNPVVQGQFQTVRPYALLGLLGAISTVGYVRRVAPGATSHARGWLPYVAVNVLGTFTHYWFFFLLAGQAVGALLFGRGSARRGLVLAVAASAIPFFLIWTPVLLDQTRGTPTSWLNVPGGFWLVSAPIQLMGGPMLAREAKIFYALLALTCVVRLWPRRGLVSLDDVSELLRDRHIGLLATIPAVAMVLAFVVSQVSPVYHVRYTIVAAPAFAMLLGHVVARLGDRVLVVVLSALFLAGSLHERHEQLQVDFQRDNRAVTQYLVDHYQDGDELVHVTLNSAPTTHYLRALAPDRSFSRTVYPAEVADHVGWRDRDRMLAQSESLRREAVELTQRLRDRSSSGRVWLLADLGEDEEITTILVEELERAFVLEETVPLEGWWVSEIRLYELREEHDGTRAITGE